SGDLRRGDEVGIRGLAEDVQRHPELVEGELAEHVVPGDRVGEGLPPRERGADAPHLVVGIRGGGEIPRARRLRKGERRRKGRAAPPGPSTLATACAAARGSRYRSGNTRVIMPAGFTMRIRSLSVYSHPVASATVSIACSTVTLFRFAVSVPLAFLPTTTSSP